MWIVGRDAAALHLKNISRIKSLEPKVPGPDPKNPTGLEILRPGVTSHWQLSTRVSVCC